MKSKPWLRVLIADGSIAVNRELTAWLSELDGLTVFGCAQEPAKVLALVEATQPDVMVVDLETAGPAGMRILKRITGLPRPPVVILLSHYNVAALREVARAAGVSHFLIKTKGLEQLQALLDDLQRTKRGRELVGAVGE